MTKKSQRRFPRRPIMNIEPSMTKQSFQDECNINNIMAKFQKTGAINHYAKHAPHYGDATPIQLTEALNIVIQAQDMFDDLPSSIRKRFNNSPEEFLEFVQNPENADEMVKMGLKNAPQAERPAQTEQTTQKPPAEDAPADPAGGSGGAAVPPAEA